LLERHRPGVILFSVRFEDAAGQLWCEVGAGGNTAIAAEDERAKQVLIISGKDGEIRSHRLDGGQGFADMGKGIYRVFQPDDVRAGFRQFDNHRHRQRLPRQRREIIQQHRQLQGRAEALEVGE